jgi:hypothetical protein
MTNKIHCDGVVYLLSEDGSLSYQNGRFMLKVVLDEEGLFQISYHGRVWMNSSSLNFVFSSSLGEKIESILKDRAFEKEVFK